MVFGCIGEKLGHSYSVEIHREIGKIVGEYPYVLRETAPQDLDRFMAERDFKGINVTIPYKKDVIKYLDWIEPSAKAVGAVNTVVNRGGRLYGWNTDIFGLRELIFHARFDLTGSAVLILGSGGTSLTAKFVAEEIGAKQVYRVSRSPAEGCISYGEALSVNADYIINTTPCGMFGNAAENRMAIDPRKFKNLRGVIDAVYNPLRTEFVLAAEEMGIPAFGGLYMLVFQALASAELFNNQNYNSSFGKKVYENILKQKQNIVLIGMGGCGKSTLGPMLADRLGKRFMDTDEEIVKQAGRTVSEIFASGGEALFRRLESQVICEAGLKKGYVIATGGGSVLDSENTAKLKANGRLIFIDRNPELISAGSGRPLMRRPEDTMRLYTDRIGIYNSAADAKITNNGEIMTALEDLETEALSRMRILVLNGPNINMIGIREPEIYGSHDYEYLCRLINRYCSENNIKVTVYQTNHEGEIVDSIQKAYYEKYDGIVLNAAAYTHTSIAIGDAIKAVKIPTVEVHISNPDEREEYRKVNFIREACVHSICGHGLDGYIQAIEYLRRTLNED